MDARTEVPPARQRTDSRLRTDSSERARLVAALRELSTAPIDLPHVIGGRHRMGAGERIDVVQPHRHSARLGTLTNADHADAAAAVEAAMAAKRAGPPPVRRAGRGVPAGRRPVGWTLAGEKIAAATMLGQSKTAYQAEIDSPCELVDFWRFNVAFARQILAQQPISGPGVWNRSDYRPLDGFVYAVTPFNFTAIAGNLPTAPALMGNTVVWKPSITQSFAAYLTMQLLEAAGLLAGVINLVTGDGYAVSEVVLADRGSRASISPAPPRPSSICGARSAPASPTTTATRVWSGRPAARTSCSPTSANPDVLRTALIRGAFDFQGQKCSAASRAFVPARCGTGWVTTSWPPPRR